MPKNAIQWACWWIGVVPGIMPYGIFVELEPSVTGLVHRLRFPTWIKGEPGDVFWPGDHVKASDRQLEHDRRAGWT